MKYYEMRFENALWCTGYFAKNVREAIKQFLLDPIYHFTSKKCSIEVRGYKKLFTVELLEIKSRIIKFEAK
jgi:hypothetical protein